MHKVWSCIIDTIITEAEAQACLQCLVRAALQLYGQSRQQFHELRAKELLDMGSTPATKMLLNELK